MKEPTKLHVSDVIDFERDILPYRVIHIISGVGSGKNYFTNQIIRKKEKSRPYRVLYITSRKTTADAQAAKINAKRWIDLTTFPEGGFGDRRLPNFFCTNSGIEYFLKNKYKEKDPSTYVWNKLDFIVLDEEHSLVADAIFSDAPFYVERFLTYALDQNPNLRVILMSGTPDGVGWLRTRLRNQLKQEEQKKVAEYNLLETCVNVVPKNVEFIDSKGAFQKLREAIKAGQKAIYFVNSIEQMKRIWTKLHENHIADTEEIACSYSDNVSFKAFEPELPTEQKTGVENELVETEELPDRIRIFLTTTKNKEGVNINNDDIKLMFAESLGSDELKQMAGRVRNGLETLYVVYDHVRQHDIDEQTKIRMQDEFFIPYLQRGYDDFTKGERYLWSDGLIKRIEDACPYIRYDMLIKKEFAFYEGRTFGIVHQYSSEKNMTKSINGWDKIVIRRGQFETYEKLTGEQYLKECFPYSIVHRPAKNLKEERYNQAKAAVELLLTSKNWLDQPLSTDLSATILEEINAISESYCQKTYRQLYRTLGQYGFEMIRGSKNKKYANIVIRKQADFSVSPLKEDENPTPIQLPTDPEDLEEPPETNRHLGFGKRE